MTRRRGTSTEYELTINGGLGPVLQTALGPEVEVRTRPCTTFVARTAADVVLLVDRLHALGLRIDSVVVVDPGIATLSP